MHGNTDIIVFFHDSVIVFSVAPEFIGLACVQISAAPVSVIQRRNIVGTAVSVHTQDRGINRKLIPSD